MNGKKIKKIRAKLDWSQSQLAEYLGIEQATVSRLERNEWPASRPVVKLLETLESRTP